MRVFLIVWFGQLISISGSQLTSFALGVWFYQSNGSVTQLSLISISALLPHVIFGPFVGVLVDRWNHRWTMILSDACAAVGTLTILILLLTNHLELWHIYLVNTVSAISATFQWPAYMASMVLLIPKQQLGRANGLIVLATAIAQIFAPPLAGALLGIINLQGVITIDLGTFVISVIILLCIRFPKIPINSDTIKSDPSHNEETAFSSLKETNNSPPSWIEEFKDGFSYLMIRPGLLEIVVFFGLIGLFRGATTILFNPLVLATNSASILGLVLAMGGVGMLLGSLVMTIWGSSDNCVHRIFVFVLLQSLCVLSAGLKVSVIIWVVCIFCYSFAVPIIEAAFMTIIQRKVLLNLQGRILSLMSALINSLNLISYLLSGLLADAIFEPLMTTNGILGKTVGLWLGRGPGRGIGLMFVIMGLCMILIVTVMYQNRNLRLIEQKLPDLTLS
ncbi:MFS transporter [Crocosphaera sp.]|uniref:MFS transporter n=1 Tax=Crocosphaera sp. TaxID=2729996 RepID=UPI002606D464|nr:MFS transporter [Crocosphaera sp.]MDJ0580936.1 MFS transporter [Crocosphaera sp.]